MIHEASLFGRLHRFLNLKDKSLRDAEVDALLREVVKDCDALRGHTVAGRAPTAPKGCRVARPESCKMRVK